mmetsp:Transcript_59848/g.107698  ORF Transcript_59848/g.107698 Transcript_59848/m.107698 type:complete len:213 (-) Transcript_59848:119-757(-)
MKPTLWVGVTGKTQSHSARPPASEVLVVITNSHVLGFLQFPLVLRDQRGVDLDLGGFGELPDELKISLVCEAPGQPKERLFEVVVAPRTQIVVLQIPLPVELDVLCLDLPVLHINLVAHEDNRDVLTHAYDVAVPVGHVFVSNAGSHVEHNDGALPLDVVSITQTAKLFLTSCIPNVEAKWPAVCREFQGMHFNSKRRNVLLLKLARQVPLH